MNRARGGDGHRRQAWLGRGWRKGRPGRGRTGEDADGDGGPEDELAARMTEQPGRGLAEEGGAGVHAGG